VKIGLFLSAQLIPGTSVEAGLEQLVEQVTLAEKLGFSSVFLGHHYLAHSQFLQPLSLINYLAPLTKTIRLGFGVYLLPLHNPLALAEEFATADVLSNGRLTVGVGSGYRKSEYAAFGVPFEERFKRLAEYVPIMQKLWRGEEVTAEGYFGQLRKAKLHLKPSQDGGPPIWMGAFGPVGIRRAAALNTAWLAPPDGNRQALKERYAIYRETLDKHGHGENLDFPLMREAVIATTTEAAEVQASQYLAKQYAQYKSWDAAQDASVKQLQEEFALVGTPDAVAEKLEWYGDELGVTEVIMRMQWMDMEQSAVLDSMHLIGERIIAAH
jgi:alkanesulfonate monooxygenase SsuD/methylene tetrahydromethanopterin reductase-like flavin-dependent oxidoreductase (luciferase family)